MSSGCGTASINSGGCRVGKTRNALASPAESKYIRALLISTSETEIPASVPSVVTLSTIQSRLSRPSPITLRTIRCMSSSRFTPGVLWVNAFASRGVAQSRGVVPCFGGLGRRGGDGLCVAEPSELYASSATCSCACRACFLAALRSLRLLPEPAKRSM